MQAIQRQPVPSQQQLDNLVDGIQQHKAVHSQKAWAAWKPEQCKHLVSKLILLAIAKSQERFKTLAVIIAGATDRQDVQKQCCAIATSLRQSMQLEFLRWLLQWWCLPMGTLLQPYGEQVWPPDVSGFTRGTCSSARCLLCICCAEVYYMC